MHLELWKLSKDLLLDILPKTADAYFAKNIGFGTGHNFSLLDDSKRKHILEIMRESKEYFPEGLGEGLGHSHQQVAGLLKRLCRQQVLSTLLEEQLEGL